MALNVRSTKETLEKILAFLKAGTPFAYTRFSDGQLLHINGWEGDKLDHVASPMLQLIQKKAIAIDDPSYLVAVQCGFKEEEHMTMNSLGLFKNDAQLEAVVRENVNDADTKEFFSSAALQYGMLYYQDLMKEILDEILKKKVAIVGGPHLKEALRFFPNAVWIDAPETDAFDEVEDITLKVYEAQPDIVLTSIGLCSQPLQYFIFIDNSNITTINFGSIFDALLGLSTRGWIRENAALIEGFKAKITPNEQA